MEFIEHNGLLLPKDKEPEKQPESWTISINMGDWGPRKATSEELAENHAKYDAVMHVREVLTKMNKLLKKNGVELYQLDKWDGYEGYERCPDIEIGSVSTFINNETGLFDLPDIPDKWDENTIVQRHMPNFGSPAVYTMGIVE